MTRIIALGALSVALLASGSHAGSTGTGSPMDGAFGNTILSTYPDGRTAELWLHPDGSYDAEGRRGDLSSGHWSTKGDKLCLKQSKPISSIIAFCKAVPEGGLAKGYTTKAVSGETIKVKLEPGRAKGRQGPPPS